MSIISAIPFFFKAHLERDNGGFPQSLPFHLYFDNDLKMFRQKTYPALSRALVEIYKKGSLAEGSISSESGRAYMDKIIEYLFEHFDFMETSKVLEVGFGSGAILKELKIKGVTSLTGIEPGQHVRASGLDGIKLIEDFFPSRILQGKYDLIFSLFVLEHIEEPIDYLNELIKMATDSGKIIFAVPNCEPYLKEGDLSIFIHEHYSYFTMESIVKIVNKTAFRVEDISIVEGAFIVTASRKDCGIQPSHECFSEVAFTEKANSYISSINSIFNNYSQKEIAIYAPIRALNFLFSVNKLGVRLVDDNSELHGKFLPALSSAIESFKSLVIDPPKCLIIFSRTFQNRIKQKCQSEEGLKDLRLLTLDDFNSKSYLNEN